MASTKHHNDKLVRLPPGNNLLSVINSCLVATEIANHLGLIHIIDDHQCLWAEAKSNGEKVKIHQRFRRQVLRGLISFGGFEVTVHGALSTAFGQWWIGSSLIVVGTAILYLTRKQ